MKERKRKGNQRKKELGITERFKKKNNKIHQYLSPIQKKKKMPWFPFSPQLSFPFHFISFPLHFTSSPNNV
jgi:hypothetical protein